MEDGDTEKYHISSLTQDFVFCSRKMDCVMCISSLLYNKMENLSSRLCLHLLAKCNNFLFVLHVSFSLEMKMQHCGPQISGIPAIKFLKVDMHNILLR